MPNMLLALLSHDAAGLAIAALFLVPGLLLLMMRRRRAGRKGVGILSLMMLAVGALLATGSIVHLVQVVQARPKAPGRFVDVRGTRIHLQAEGPKGAAPTLVWFAGAHSGGNAVYHLHRRLRDRFHSVLIDRPGTGWSDVGSFPRTTAKEAEEMWAALDAAGEKGPYVLIGHSFGGLLAANMARRQPNRVKAVVLLDATPPDTIVYGPKLSALGDMRRDALLGGLFRLFALDYDKVRGAPPPPLAKLEQQVNKELGPQGVALRAVEKAPATSFAAYSIFREISPLGLADVAWDTVVYDGDLDPLPVYLVAPGELIEWSTLPEAATAEQQEAVRMQRFFAITRERYLATSGKSQRIYAPKGTGHNFPYEAPDFVASVVAQAASR